MDKPIDRVRVSTYSREPSDLERTYYGALIQSFVARRTHLKLSQEELDQRLGVGEGQVAKWEAFFRLPGAFMLVCWANALGISITVTHPDSIKE